VLMYDKNPSVRQKGETGLDSQMLMSEKGQDLWTQLPMHQQCTPTQLTTNQSYVSELETLELLNEEHELEEEYSENDDLNDLREDRETGEIMHFVFGDDSEDESRYCMLTCQALSFVLCTWICTQMFTDAT